MIIIAPPLTLSKTHNKGHVTLFSVIVLPLPALPSTFNMSLLIAFTASLFPADESVTVNSVAINNHEPCVLSDIHMMLACHVIIITCKTHLFLTLHNVMCHHVVD